MTVRKTVAPFNLLVAGHTRAGKTDFIHTLFETVKVVRLGGGEEVSVAAETRIFPLEVTAPTPSLYAIECHPDPDLLEKISLTLIDSPGLSIPAGLRKAPKASVDALERYAAAWAHGITNYYETQFQARLENEAKIKRTRERDSLVHACLYLLSPDVVLANHGLSSMDVIALKILCERVNVIPCIAKSDMVSVRELKTIKTNLLECFRKENLPLYLFDDDEEDLEEEEVLISDHIPFCLVNSEELSPATETEERQMGVSVNDSILLGREFMWGVFEVQNPRHCDLSLLKSALFDLYIDDLKEETNLLYEKWRTGYMSKNRRSIHVPPDLSKLVESLENVDMIKENSVKSVTDPDKIQIEE